MDEDFIAGVFWAVKHAGLEDVIDDLIEYLRSGRGELEDSPITREAVAYDRLDATIWQGLVQAFGDYDRTPRDGWVDATDEAAEWLSDWADRTYRWEEL